MTKMTALEFLLTAAAAVVLLCLRGDGSSVSAENRQPDETTREEVPERCPTRHSPVASSQPFGMSFSSKVVREMEAPEEKDHRLRPFHVLNPEGELFMVDTGAEGPFYGPVWTRVLDAYEKGEFLRARVAFRKTSRQNEFSGYVLSLDGLPVFLPRSKSFYFYDEKKDAAKRCIAVKIESIYPNGPRIGNVVVNAKPAWDLVRKGLYRLAPGIEVHALAMDIDQGGGVEEGHLVFPAPEHRRILVPLPEARRLARQAGQSVPDDFLTGLYWRLRLIAGDESAWQAEPLEVLI